jgi:hypothetical protein
MQRRLPARIRSGHTRLKTLQNCSEPGFRRGPCRVVIFLDPGIVGVAEGESLFAHGLINPFVQRFAGAPSREARGLSGCGVEPWTIARSRRVHRLIFVWTAWPSGEFELDGTLREILGRELWRWRVVEIAFSDYKTDFPPNTVNRTLKLHFKRRGIRRLLCFGRLALNSDERMAP